MFYTNTCSPVKVRSRRGTGTRGQVALGGALRQDAQRGDRARPGRPRQGWWRARQARARGLRRRQGRDPTRDDASHPRRHRCRRPPRSRQGRCDALRGDARVARGARAARGRAAGIAAARRRPRGTADEAGPEAPRGAAAGTAPPVRWVVLLRAVNLGARNKVPMAQLRTLLEEEAGYEDVRTYIASGNVLLDGPRGKSAVARKLEGLIADAFDVETVAIVRTPRELSAIVADRPTRKAAESLAAADHSPDRAVVAGRDVYVQYPAGVHGSRLSAARLERLLDVPGTHRNWRTVAALAELAAEA